VGNAMSEARKLDSSPPSKGGKPRQRRSNRRRRQKSLGLDVPAMIDEFFHRPTELTEGGTSRRVTYFEVILHHLWRKSMAGSRKAFKLFTRYMKFAKSQGKSGEIEFRFGPEFLTAEEVLKKHGRIS
jgi:hypothetical protein